MSACSHWEITRMWLVYLLFITIETCALIFLIPIINEEPARWICTIISILKFVVVLFLFAGSLLTNTRIFDFAIKLHQIHSIITPIAGLVVFPLRLALADAFALGIEMLFLFIYFFFTVPLNLCTYGGNKLASTRIGYLESDKRSESETRQDTKKSPLINNKSEPKGTSMIHASYEPLEVNKPIQGSPMIYTSYEPVQGTPMIQTSYEPLTIKNSQPPQQAGHGVEGNQTNLFVDEKNCYKNDFK
jgi:hypothetical protein